MSFSNCTFGEWDNVSVDLDAPYRQQITEEGLQKKKEWLKENGFNENEETYIYFPSDSYEIKNELKNAGFIYSKLLLWHSDKIISGYEDKIIKIHLSQVAEMNIFGTGVFRQDAKAIIYQKLEEKRPAAAPSNSKWFGEIGYRFYELPVTLKSIKTIEVETVFLWSQRAIFEDERGNLIEWDATVPVMAEVGEKVLLNGTIKWHLERQGVKYTQVTRCRLKQFSE